MDKTGKIHRNAELTPLCGHEEELLAGSRNQTSMALVTSILCRCVKCIGSINPVSEEVARSLLVADRQFLLLKLREVTFGEQVRANISCPWPDCGEKIDIDFLIKDIPVRESTDKGPAYIMELSPEAALTGEHGNEQRKIVYRLPNGGDQEAISSLISKNEALALSMLLKRCILSMGPVKNPDSELINTLSPLARMEIEKQMSEVSPMIDLTLGVTCPECNREFAVPFDLQDFFFGELRTSKDLLYREIHYLAYHYHWSEREILEMPREKRRKYIEVLADEIERLNNVA